MNTSFIVLGGGIIGLACALELRLRGAAVTVLEAETCGGQASGAAAGMLAPYSENPESPDEFFRLCRESLDLYPNWQQRIRELSGIDFEYTESGSLYAAYHEADLLALESRLRWQRQHGSSGELLRGAALVSAEPGLSRQVVAALRTPEERHVYAPDLVGALIAACLNAGVLIREQLGKLELAAWERGVEVRAAGDSGEAVFQADQLVICTGAWAGHLPSELGLELPVHPIRGQICAYPWDTRQAGTEPVRHMIFSSQGYLVQKANGTLVCGASEDVAGFDTSVTERGIARLLRWNRSVLPALEDRQPIHRWAGLRPATLDGRPLIGRLSRAERVILAAGHYRNGILLAPATAKLVADLAQGREAEPWQQAFRPERFHRQTVHRP
ncbi:glycine oxidase ThiO [Saccharibacillus sp. JS10]|uniref:glycine oxidase ThiO n=1 Tax=Saccharibacillus sp. JS10 TaxID=2950552 RepID=UPI00210DC197|nr:glycine oxidase ThiO [Saccharibacillus sp. JS10]MCQ4087858.1 glycine oxidase ThiO [Saccharibacillus sp. JS10]